MCLLARKLLACAVLLALPACGRGLENGTYAFTTTGIRQDSCSVEPEATLPLPEAEVESAGDSIRLEFAAEGPLVPGLTGASGDKALIGRYLPDREVERFIADATFDVVREIQGFSCFVFAHSSIEARVRDDESFTGRLRIDYTRRPEAQPECLPACIVEVDFDAAKIGD
ncbi:hypothetical protein [Vulgatibacter sp.]|uniref:hypothetical protein n=1 Tax=Vulgatibacter sp. TaxID=1971226 RepID=UPI00356AB3D9